MSLSSYVAYIWRRRIYLLSRLLYCQVSSEDLTSLKCFYPSYSSLSDPFPLSFRLRTQGPSLLSYSFTGLRDPPFSHMFFDSLTLSVPYEVLFRLSSDLCSTLSLITRGPVSVFLLQLSEFLLPFGDWPKFRSHTPLTIPTWRQSLSTDWRYTSCLTYSPFSSTVLYLVPSIVTPSPLSITVVSVRPGPFLLLSPYLRRVLTFHFSCPESLSHECRWLPPSTSTS